MEISEFSRINKERCDAWHPGGMDDWSVADWSNAMAGEAGEVCNAVKKYRRLETGAFRSGSMTKDEAIDAIALELGDTFVYLDHLAQKLGIDFEDAIRRTFNRVSEREGLTQRI